MNVPVYYNDEAEWSNNRPALLAEEDFITSISKVIRQIT